jgi:hypothetical protein
MKQKERELVASEILYKPISTIELHIIVNLGSYLYNFLLFLSDFKKELSLVKTV